MKQFKFQLLRVLLFLIAATLVSNRPAEAKSKTNRSPSSVSLANRHIVVLNADNQYLWGAYYFAIVNHDKSPQEFQTEILLPKEATDFEPQSGIENHEILLSEEGKPSIKKIFQPGLTLINIGFKIPHNPWNYNKLSFSPSINVPEFSVATLVKNKLNITSKHLTPGLPHMLPGDQYTGIIGQLKTGETTAVLIGGLPLPRTFSWIIALMTAFLLLLLASSLAVKAQLNLSYKK